MTDPRQSETGPDTSGDRSGSFNCATMELWLAEAAEQALPAATAQQVRDHAAKCAACREKLAQARSGREWLLVLKQEVLEPPADLVAKILARTNLTGAGAEWTFSPLNVESKHGGNSGPFVGGAAEAVPSSAELGASPETGTAIAAWQHSSVVVLRRTLLDPRLALVAAMAFFSITLTLNMLGFRLTKLHAADLRPENMHRAVVRQCAEANASVVRYYENLRIVYEVETRVQQLRRAAETNPQPQGAARPRKQSSDFPNDSNGGSIHRPAESRQDGLAVNPGANQRKHAHPPAQADPKPIATGPRMDAALERTRQAPPFTDRVQIAIGHTLATSFVAPFLFQPASQALSCSPRNTCTSMRCFSTRERRLA